MSLQYKVFQHSPAGFSGTSTLIYGERDAIPVDTTFFLNEDLRQDRQGAGILLDPSGKVSGEGARA